MTVLGDSPRPLPLLLSYSFIRSLLAAHSKISRHGSLADARRGISYFLYPYEITFRSHTVWVGCQNCLASGIWARAATEYQHGEIIDPFCSTSEVKFKCKGFSLDIPKEVYERSFLKRINFIPQVSIKRWSFKGMSWTRSLASPADIHPFRIGFLSDLNGFVRDRGIIVTLVCRIIWTGNSTFQIAALILHLGISLFPCWWPVRLDCGL